MSFTESLNAISSDVDYKLEFDGEIVRIEAGMKMPRLHHFDVVLNSLTSEYNVNRRRKYIDIRKYAEINNELEVERHLGHSYSTGKNIVEPIIKISEIKDSEKTKTIVEYNLGIARKNNNVDIIDRLLRRMNFRIKR